MKGDLGRRTITIALSVLDLLMSMCDAPNRYSVSKLVILVVAFPKVDLSSISET